MLIVHKSKDCINIKKIYIFMIIVKNLSIYFWIYIFILKKINFIILNKYSILISDILRSLKKSFFLYN